MKNLIILIVAILFVSGCATENKNQVQKNQILPLLNKIKLGQSEKEIINLFGEPDNYVQEVDKKSHAIITHLDYFSSNNNINCFRFIFLNDKLFKYDLTNLSK